MYVHSASRTVWLMGNKRRHRDAVEDHRELTKHRVNKRQRIQKDLTVRRLSKRSKKNAEQTREIKKFVKEFRSNKLKDITTFDIEVNPLLTKCA